MIRGLKDYLLQSAKEGYASGKFKTWIKEKDLSTTITNEIKEFRMHDNFFGGEPYGGREVVFREDKPVWMMVYYGKVTGGGPDEIYKVLRKALSLPENEMPIRGPRSLNFENYSYKFSWKGTLGDFKATEKISLKGKELYSATFAGGEIDRRKGN
ncbi:MAG: Transcriptional regulator, XRE family [uncultured bacterium]|nr:MAG: Transcriptional regulator, XRE family [uncultured bacterium]